MPELRRSLSLPPVVQTIGAISAWGVTESVIFASLFTLVEAGALLAVVIPGERLCEVGRNAALGKFGIDHHPRFCSSGEMDHHRWR